MTTMTRTARGAANLLALSLLLGVPLTACGADTPEICQQTEQLRNSLTQLQNINLSEDGLGSYTTTLTQIRTELEEVKAAAGTQYGPQLDAIRTAVDQVQGRVSLARVEPSAAALGQIGVALGQLQSAVAGLRTSISNTC